MMTCEQVEELLAAYALDAVTDRERREIEAHLATCDGHFDAADLAAAIGLGYMTEEREPSEALEARLLASITRPRSLPRQSKPWWPAAAAAALLLAVFGFAAGFLVGGGGEDAPALVHVYSEDGASMRVVRLDGDRVEVTMSGLVRREAGEAYQVWAVRDGRWLSVGVCNTDEDRWWFGDFAFEATPSDAFALTIEPAGGSASPTGVSVLGVSR